MSGSDKSLRAFLIARAPTLGVALAVCWWLCGSLASADEPWRLRLEWGGGAEQIWHGSLSLSEGSLTRPQALGIEADTPGSMWLDGNQLQIASPSRRLYEGVEIDVSAPLDATLRIALGPPRSQPQSIEVPLRNLLEQALSEPLDTQGNRLVVRRAPGDSLRLRLKHDSLVFAPQDTMRLEVLPTLLSSADQVSPRLECQLVSAGTTRAIWSESHTLTARDDGTFAGIELQVPLPHTEGVYELLLGISRRTGLSTGLKIADPIGWRSLATRRQLQLVVAGSERRDLPEAELELLAEIDPAAGSWSQRLPEMARSLPWVASSSASPLRHSRRRTISTPGGNLLEIAPPEMGDIPWEAYRLAVARPGEPHVVEIDYAADVAQSLALSIVEPNSASAVVPLGVDSGVYTQLDERDSSAVQAQPLAQVPIVASTSEVAKSSPAVLVPQSVGTTATHRLTFWPRTASPLLLVSTTQPNTTATISKIRLLGPKPSRGLPGITRQQAVTPTRLPPALASDALRGERLWAAYYDRPLFAENFSAPQALDTESPHAGRTLRDWRTYDVGTSRLVDYAQHAGFNALFVSALADGSTIYPSRLLEPTPRYDDGVFFQSAQDPVRKDVLALLLRRAHVAKLRVIPTLEFAAPLPRLETLKRRRGDLASEHDTSGIEMLGADGQPWTHHYRPRGGLAPYYNPLDPRVQEAMLDVVRELLSRYSSHAAFGGVALTLSADGYAQLPLVAWPMDEATLDRFAADAGIALPSASPAARRERVGRVLGEHRALWLRWRAQELSKFYERLAAEVEAQRPGARLYLLGADMFVRRELRKELAPALPRETSVETLMLQLGVDVRQLTASERIVFARPYRFAGATPLPAQAANLELNQSASLDPLFAGAKTPAAMFFHEPCENRLTSFELSSPFEPTYLHLATQALPGGEQNRRRFAQALATLDAQMLLDGGWTLPLGQEAALAEWVAAYRRLPAVKFETLEGVPQPLVVRTHRDAYRKYVYLVNHSPWTIEASLVVTAPVGTRFEAFGRCPPPPEANGSRQEWTLRLEPYALVAGAFVGPEAELVEPRVSLSPLVAQQLETRIQDLWARAAQLKEPRELAALENPDFEALPTAAEPLPGWYTPTQSGATLRLETRDARRGKQSVHLQAAAQGAVLESKPFALAPTGRVSVALWLRTADEHQQPVLRLAVAGQADEAGYYRYARLGADTPQTLTMSWKQFVFQVNDLPTSELEALSVRLEVHGAGEVWVDDVRLYELDFSDAQRLELSKTITLADYKRTSGSLADCQRLLEGYWPRFLTSYVPTTGETVATRPK